MIVTLQTTMLGPVDVDAGQILAAADRDPRPHAYDAATLEEIARQTVHWTGIFQLRTSIIAAQMLHETGNFRYGGQVKPEQFNMAGLGATNDGAVGATFATVSDGVRAVCSHHMAYIYGPMEKIPAHLRPLMNTPRHQNVLDAGYGGVVEVVMDYSNSRWAWSPQYPKGSLENGYARSLVRIANIIREMPKTEKKMNAQTPGFAWLPANETHYTKGRTQKIRGGAQHYTAGTDSRAWLTWQSGQDDPRQRVSAHFLIKKNPTMADRGWQLVRIEDTAWTTGAANPYTVSIEYEHRAYESIPDIAYEVMAQTWIDIANYVKAKNLGEIALTRSGIKGHNEWTPGTVCPNGIQVGRIVSEIDQLQKAKPEPAPEPKERCFEQTGFCIAHGFKDYWENTENAIEMLGYPISREFDRDGITMQWFERARLEFQPEIASNRYGVVLGRIGAEGIREDQKRYPSSFERQI